MADARDVLRQTIDEIAGSVDWDDWPDRILDALGAAGLAVVPKGAMIDESGRLWRHIDIGNINEKPRGEDLPCPSCGR